MHQSKSRRLLLLATIVAALVVIFDQILKFYIKTHFYLGEDVEELSFFHKRFINNNGMAFCI